MSPRSKVVERSSQARRRPRGHDLRHRAHTSVLSGERGGPLAVSALCFGGICAMLPTTMVVPLQPELPQMLGTSPAAAGWVMTITLLVGCVAMPLAGRLGDLVGRRRVLIALMTASAAGSVICAMAESLLPMLAGRALQGLGMGFMPVAMAAVRQVTSARLAPTGMAAMSATMGVGGAIGLPGTSAVLEYAHWPVLFWTAAAINGLAVLTLATLLPPLRGHRGRFDPWGAILLAIGVVLVLLGISRSTDWGWADARSLGSIMAGLGVVACWCVFELRHSHPMVDLRASSRRPVLLTNLAAIAVGFGMMGSAILLPFLFRLPERNGGFALTMLETGLCMAPGGLLMLATSPFAGRLLVRVGAPRALTGAAGVMGAGYFLAALAVDHLVWLLISTSIVAVGTCIAYAAMPILVMDHVSADHEGSAVGVNALMRSIGTTTSSAVLVTVLASGATAGGLPTGAGIVIAFLVTAGVVSTAVLVAFFIPRHPRAVVDTTESLHPGVPLVRQPLGVIDSSIAATSSTVMLVLSARTGSPRSERRRPKGNRTRGQ